METTETVDVYISKVFALTNQMKTNGETHSEQAKVEKILRSLNPKFEHVVATIKEANDISTMTVRLLSGSLRVHEQRMNDNKIEKPIERDLQAQTSIGSSYHKHGCTNHMCGQKELLADLDDSFRTKVKFGDGRFVSVPGKGRILITLKNGDHMYIYDVFYVSDMKSNL
ncbi:uncharacterized protein [Phaseolus vulgaris]|uniref:uncharacterized protein n=1 Tax=Phaseolus vulgaris TaxID=3885 RepID=UPI0035CA5714